MNNNNGMEGGLHGNEDGGFGGFGEAAETGGGETPGFRAFVEPEKGPGLMGQHELAVLEHQKEKAKAEAELEKAKTAYLMEAAGVTGKKPLPVLADMEAPSLLPLIVAGGLVWYLFLRKKKGGFKWAS